jgi:putative addiction module component (TIGR02574 family)
MSMTLEQFGIDRLSSEDRLALIDMIWDSLPEDAAFTPPEWHLKLLEERLAEADANPGEGKPWKEVLARLSAPR